MPVNFFVTEIFHLSVKFSAKGDLRRKHKQATTKKIETQNRVTAPTPNTHTPTHGNNE